MYITILQIGKSDPYILEGEKEYLKFLKPFAKIETITVNDESQLQKHLKKDQFVIVLERAGKELSSEEFAEHIRKLKNQGQKLIFVIGGPFGLSRETLKKANLLLSFSRMTFTHQMIRLILLEQLYRAFTIISGKKYHY